MKSLSLLLGMSILLGSISLVARAQMTTPVETIREDEELIRGDEELKKAKEHECYSKVTDPAWAEQDFHVLILSCKLIKTTEKQYAYENLCFAITDKAYDNFNETWYTTYLYNPNQSGGNLDIAHEYTTNQSIMEVRSEHGDIFNPKSLHKTSIDFSNNTLSYEIRMFTNIWGGTRFFMSSQYQCQYILDNP